jgi:hypothetical protein
MKRTRTGEIVVAGAAVGKAPKKKTWSKIPVHNFHRWLTAFDSGVGTSFVNVTNCTYDGTDSFITCTASQKTCSFSTAFQLRDLPNITDFTTLFDSYMIDKVLIQFKLIDNPDAAYPTNGSDTSSVISKTNFFPTIWYAPDNDDNNNVTLAQIKEFERVKHKVLYPNRETNILLRPTTLSQLYRSTTTTGYAENHKRQWLDLANTDIPHYGFKAVIDFEGLAPVGTYRIKINAKYFFKCKNCR